jgi:hypothetical protein
LTESKFVIPNFCIPNVIPNLMSVGISCIFYGLDLNFRVLNVLRTHRQIINVFKQPRRRELHGKGSLKSLEGSAAPASDSTRARTSELAARVSATPYSAARATSSSATTPKASETLAIAHSGNVHARDCAVASWHLASSRTRLAPCVGCRRYGPRKRGRGFCAGCSWWKQQMQE